MFTRIEACNRYRPGRSSDHGPVTQPPADPEACALRPRAGDLRLRPRVEPDRVALLRRPRPDRERECRDEQHPAPRGTAPPIRPSPHNWAFRPRAGTPRTRAGPAASLPTAARHATRRQATTKPDRPAGTPVGNRTSVACRAALSPTTASACPSRASAAATAGAFATAPARPAASAASPAPAAAVAQA
jgi:hypothetical protein